MLALSSTAEALSALGRARQVDIAAYTLPRPVVLALEAAARRGAAVTVKLAGRPYKDPKGRLTAENRKLAKELSRAGARVALDPMVHAKVLTADGTLYLDEKNWRSGDLVLCDGDAAEAAQIPMVKHEALAQEARLIDGARRSGRVIVESESFGCCNAVYGEIRKAARTGGAPRLLVAKRDLSGNARERQIIEALVRDGVAVRVCDDSEKLAAAGNAAWLGSANATIAAPGSDSTDWGLCTTNSQIVATVRARLEAQWQTAKPFRASRIA